MTQLAVPQAIDPEAVALAQAAALPEEILNLMVGVFDALSDPTRVRILHALIQHPMCVRDLSIIAGVTESAVSHQLRYMRDRRLVKSRRDGTIIYYSIADLHVAVLFKEADHHADHVRNNIPDHPYP